MKRLSKNLWNKNKELALKCLNHPFVRGISNGYLDKNKFRNYVSQDTFFLNAFLRVYALAASKCERKWHIKIFHKLMEGVLTELQLHSLYSRKLKIKMQNVEPMPACKKYTNFLLKTARKEDLGSIIAAMTPCMSLYAFIGKRLSPIQKKNHKYSDWIKTYSSNEMQKLARKLEKLLDKLVKNENKAAKFYRKAMIYELEFFSDVFKNKSK